MNILICCSNSADDAEFDRYLRRARQLALWSNLKNHRHGCVIVDNASGQIIAEGYNYKSDGLANPQLNSMHAEMQAIASYRPLRRLYPNCSMFVVRIGSDNMGHPLKYSKPCRMCSETIVRAGIKRVYYSAQNPGDARTDDYAHSHSHSHRSTHSMDGASSSGSSSSGSNASTETKEWL